MTDLTLLLRLEGPLQAWGERSRWDVRDTSPIPTKSGVVGLLACALGYGVGDPRLSEELDIGLRLAVRVESAGELLDDFHTVSGFLPMAKGGFKHRDGTSDRQYDPQQHRDLKPATIVSPRTYLEDAAFLAILRKSPAASPDLLEKCAAALNAPRWPLFLGRKSCVPTRPIFDDLTDRYLDLEDALFRHPWSWLGAEGSDRTAPSGSLIAEVEDDRGDVVRQDKIQRNSARVYGFRRIRRISGIVPPLTGGI